MVSLLRFLTFLMVVAFAGMALFGDKTPEILKDLGRVFDSKKNTSSDYRRSHAGSSYSRYAPRSPRAISRGARRRGGPDPYETARQFVPVDRAAFEAAEDLMRAKRGSPEAYNATGRLIRESAKATGRMGLNAAKETWKAVRSKAFRRGLFGKK